MVRIPACHQDSSQVAGVQFPDREISFAFFCPSLAHWYGKYVVFLLHNFFGIVNIYTCKFSVGVTSSYQTWSVCEKDSRMFVLSTDSREPTAESVASLFLRSDIVANFLWIWEDQEQFRTKAVFLDEMMLYTRACTCSLTHRMADHPDRLSTSTIILIKLSGRLIRPIPSVFMIRNSRAKTKGKEHYPANERIALITASAILAKP